ncbi:DUF2326 domain-containing protein [Azotobacter salinestris]|uniref:DUF2326 domain-containing protein n=1 Tax=Azotobacter salinestris TaxID=69964 RepID=UPI001266C7E7|nr:DUF2326 domain-containing protein [Azotobacter salinestris]
MLLHRLNVYKNKELLRQVVFKKGLNLIINADSKLVKSGNSIGKTTPSRLLDYLFLSAGSDIYTEPEFKKDIPEVSSFIDSNDILVELEFFGFDNKPKSISRSLKRNPSDSEFYVNGVLSDKKSYSEFVAANIFGLTGEKPSIRNLSNKFIRNTNEKMQNTARFLHLLAKPDVYDQVYLFLFGFAGLDLLKEKAHINNQISIKKKHLAAYRNPYKESALEKMIKPLVHEEEDLKSRISSFDFKDAQEGSVQELVRIQGEISGVTMEYSKEANRIDYLKRFIEKLKGDAASIDGKELYDIYSDAGVSVSGSLKRSYEDLIVFHNKILSNKLELIKKELSLCEASYLSLKKEVHRLQELEGNVFRGIKEPDTLKSIGQMYNDLSSVREKIASVKVLLEKIELAKGDIALLEAAKANVVEEIYKNTKMLDHNIELFNSYFGDLSKLFYDERYIFDLAFDLEKERCEFDIACITPNSTGGKKKGELSAFDLAYINFVNEAKLKRPTFVVHDGIEDVDANQVFDIFQCANKIDGQYIVALLRDKISDSRFEVFKKDSVILELSEDDKFFRI